MMTPTLLERATQAFRRGYRDGHALRAPQETAPEGTFVRTDYDDGYWAARNEQYWDAIAENNRKETA